MRLSRQPGSTLTGWTAHDKVARKNDLFVVHRRKPG